MTTAHPIYVSGEIRAWLDDCRRREQEGQTMTTADKLVELMRGGLALTLGGWCDRYKARYGEPIQDSTISARFRRELKDRVGRERKENSSAWVYWLKD